MPNWTINVCVESCGKLANTCVVGEDGQRQTGYNGEINLVGDFFHGEKDKLSQNPISLPGSERQRMF